MARKSARFIAQELIGYTTADVYKIWNDMNLVCKDKFGNWTITEFGRSIGGRMSKSDHLSVPTFDADKIIDTMTEWYKTHKM